MPLQHHLRRLMEARTPLSQAEARDVMDRILNGAPSEIQVAALLGALAAREETAAEIAGFAEAMRAAALPLPLTPAERSHLVDSCGTGGDSSGTFNISTAAALVAAAAGATVAKHGNRAVTSRSGSADVLEALGIPIDHTPATAADALRRHRFAFLHAPALHPTMRAVMPVRRALGVRTLFNIVGPLTNPAGAARQVMGVFAHHLVPLVAEAMRLLGNHRALVVFGESTAKPAASGATTSSSAISREASPSPHHPPLGLDELSLDGPSHIAELRDGTITRWTLTPEDLGLTRAPLADLRGGDADTNARILEAIFAGETGPRRDVVTLNAAAVLLVAEVAPDLPAALALAEKAVDSGAVTTLVQALSRTPAKTIE